MTKKFRFMTGLLAIVLAFVMLSSVAYIAAEAGHDCTGADCAICHQINVCENLLKSIGLAGSAAAAAAALLCDFIIFYTFSLPFCQAAPPQLPQRRSYMFCAGSFPPARRLPAPLRWYRSR